MSFIPQLEWLEARALLDANTIESAAGALRNDMARFRNDVATSALALVNAVQSSPASVANQMNKVESVLAADWGQMQQVFVQFESALLGTYQHEFDALLADWAGYLTGQAPSPPPSAPSSGAGSGSMGSGHGSGGNPSSGGIPSPRVSGHDPLYVLDLNTGESIPSNATLNTFSTWNENLLAQVAGGTVSSYSWNVSGAPDLTNVSGTNTANLQGTWANFTGTARTDTISVTETTNGQPITQTMTFEVAGTDSPAFSSSRPTSSSTWPTVITPDQLSSGQATQAAGPYASIGEDDGSVQTSFSMPSYNPNTTAVSLDYNSTTANAQPIFLAEYQLPLGQSVPSTITAQLTFNRTPLSTVTYNTSGLNPGDIVQIALQANATGLTTGRYPWSITVTNNGTPTTYSGNVNIVNQANSPFGAGWSLDNVEQLLPVTGGVILVEPGGTSLWFASNGQGNYTSPAGDFSTLVQNQDNSYTRTLTDGTKINFNSSGQETSSVDRDGNTTTFGYTNGQLTSITDMNGQVTTLAYTSGLLSSITDPANRTATLTYTGKQLTSITDPGSDVWQYAYDAANDLTSLTDPNSHTTTFAYNFADRVSSVTLADDSTEQLTAMQMNGLAAPGTGTPSNPATAVLLAVGDQALLTDGNNNVWATGLDWLGFGLDTADIDPLGDAALTYRDANGLAWMSADGLGRRTRDFFDGKGNILEEVAPDDTTQQYQYNSFSEVTQYTDQESNITQYAYNSKGDLTQITDALNGITTYGYNSAGLVTSTTDPNSNTTTNTYNSLNELASTTNALNGVSTYTYDSAGDLISNTDPSNFTSTYSYNALGLMTGKTLPDTTGVNSVYSYTYDKVGNLLTSTDPNNHTTTNSYNAVNELVSITNPLNDTTSYGYDKVGNLTSVTDPLSDQTNYVYNAANELVSTTDPMGDKTTYTYDAAGEETGMTDPMGIAYTYDYTPRGELADIYITGDQSGGGGLGMASIQPTQGQGPQLWIKINHAPCGCPIGTIAYPVHVAIPLGPSSPNLSPPPGGEQTSYQRDALHRITSVTDPMNNTTSYTYDKDSNLTGVTDPNGHTVSYTYNAMNKVASMTNALNQTTTYSYNSLGYLSSVTDPLNNVTSYTYDDQGRVLTETAPNSGVTTYSYDVAGNLLSLTDPDNNVTKYSYNEANQLVSMTNPQGHQTTYSYNAAGLLTSTTDADGRTIDYGYDKDGRETSETWVGGNYTATFAYNADSQLSSASDPNSTYTYTYDQYGDLASVSNAGTPGVPAVTLSYSYDGYFNRASLSDSLGGSIDYNYNSDNQMTGLSLLLSNTVQAQLTMSYDGAGNLTGLTRTAPSASGDTITSSYSYDKANELTNISDADVTKSLTLANYTYSYNSGGELTGYQDNSGNALTYGYDANGELTSATGTLNNSNYSVSYSYDANGNRTMSGYQTGTGNELLSDGTNNYTYDNVGNMTSQTNIATGYVTYYTWDYENRLIEVKQEDNQGNVLNDEKFTYDVFGNRIAVSLNGAPQLYTVYDGANPYMDFNGSGALTERYLTNPKALSQFYGQVDAGGTTQWFLTDNINSIRQVISTSGSVLDAITYDPYGDIINQTNSTNAPRVLYAGGAYDSKTSNYQFGARPYSPTDGRFQTEDWTGFAAGDTNLYRYVFNDPLGMNDPTGFGTTTNTWYTYPSGKGIIKQINGQFLWVFETNNGTLYQYNYNTGNWSVQGKNGQWQSLKNPPTPRPPIAPLPDAAKPSLNPPNTVPPPGTGKGVSAGPDIPRPPSASPFGPITNTPDGPIGCPTGGVNPSTTGHAVAWAILPGAIGGMMGGMGGMMGGMGGMMGGMGGMGGLNMQPLPPPHATPQQLLDWWQQWNQYWWTHYGPGSIGGIPGMPGMPGMPRMPGMQ